MTAREPKVLLTSLSRRKNTPETSLIAPKISAMKQKSKGDGNPSISDKDCGRTLSQYTRSAKETEPRLKKSQNQKDNRRRSKTQGRQTWKMSNLVTRTNVVPHKSSEVRNSQARRVRQNINGMHLK